MKNVDFRSFLLGLVFSLFLWLGFAFKDSQEANPAIGTYAVETSENELIILNTVTGEYIIDGHYIDIGSSKTTFKKSSFDQKFKSAKNH